MGGLGALFQQEHEVGVLKFSGIFRSQVFGFSCEKIVFFFSVVN